MKTILLQAFAKLPEAEPESHWLGYAVLIAASFAMGFILGRLISLNKSYSIGYLDGFRTAITPQPGDIACKPQIQTIKIAPRNVALKSLFQVSQPGDLPTDMGWHSNSREIK